MIIIKFNLSALGISKCNRSLKVRYFNAPIRKYVRICHVRIRINQLMQVIIKSRIIMKIHLSEKHSSEGACTGRKRLGRNRGSLKFWLKIHLQIRLNNLLNRKYIRKKNWSWKKTIMTKKTPATIYWISCKVLNVNRIKEIKTILFLKILRLVKRRYKVTIQSRHQIY